MGKLAKTISIHLICEMEKINNRPANFDFNVGLDLDGTGEIKITPTSANASFRDAYLISNFSDTDITDEISRTVAINLVANLELFDTEDDDFEVSIDDVGQVVITPYAALDGVEGDGKFVAFKLEKSSTLVVEEEESENQTDIDIESVQAQVLDEQADVEDVNNLDNIESCMTLAEGVDELPFDLDSARELEWFMSEPRSKDFALTNLDAIFSDKELADNIAKNAGEGADIRELVKERLAQILDQYDKDRSEFKLEIDSNTRRILDKILNIDFTLDTLVEDIELADDESAWKITYEFPIKEALEGEDSESTDTDIIYAPDAETAIKYAEQSARIKAKDDSRWLDAEVIGVRKQG